MPFDPIKVCWVHQLDDALEEHAFAAIDQLEKPDEEEGEGWGTIKANSPPCEPRVSVGSASGLVQPLQTDPSLARSFGLRMNEGKYTSYPVCIGARERWGLRSWIEDVLARRTRAIGRW